MQVPRKQPVAKPVDAACATKPASNRTSDSSLVKILAVVAVVVEQEKHHPKASLIPMQKNSRARKVDSKL